MIACAEEASIVFISEAVRDDREEGTRSKEVDAGCGPRRRAS